MKTNFFSLGKTLIEVFFFMKLMTRSYSDPVYWTDEKTGHFLELLNESPLMHNRFAIAIDIRTMKPIYFKNVENYLSFKGSFTMDKYFKLVHKHYLEDYLKWGQAVYLYASQVKDKIVPMQQTYRISIPIKLKSNDYYWVLSEGYPLQVDKNNNLVRNLNIYTVLRPFNSNEKQPLTGDLWDKHYRHDIWTKALWKKRFIMKPFILTPSQKMIVNELKNNIDLTNSQVAEILKKKKNNIDIQNKQILTRARDSFPDRSFSNIKDVVQMMINLENYEKEFPMVIYENGNDF